MVPLALTVFAAVLEASANDLTPRPDGVSAQDAAEVLDPNLVHMLMQTRVMNGYGEFVNRSSGGNVSNVYAVRSVMEYLGATICNASDHGAGFKSPDFNPKTWQVWGLGFLFVTLINLSSLLGVIFLPFMNKRFYKKLLMVMIGLAVGSLSASSTFQLIPQAFQLDTHRHREYLHVSLMIWVGIWMFFLVERILRIVTSLKGLPAHSKLPTKEPCTDLSSEADDGYYGHGASAHGHNHQIRFKQGEDSVVATVAWMVVFGDGFHNFVDGLSMGAAFSEGPLTGVGVSVAVLCEELPHELGDFAVLLAAGMTLRQALLYNFLSACTCYAGLVVGVLLGEFEAATHVFGFAAGMFLYIALVDMMPELNAAAEDAAGKGGAKGAAATLLLQNVGLLLGASVLFALARFQDDIQLW